jgi:hypothetical protein
LSYINLYFFRKELTFLPLKIGGAPGKPERGREYTTIGISGGGMTEVNINSAEVLKLYILTFKRLSDIYR